MSFTTEIEGNNAVLTLAVEKLNAANVADLKTEIVRVGNQSVNNLVIDMSKTKYCDSSGLSALLIANRMCKNTNGKFVLCGLQPNVQKLIQIAQLDKVLSITETAEEAQAIIA